MSTQCQRLSTLSTIIILLLTTSKAGALLRAVLRKIPFPHPFPAGYSRRYGLYGSDGKETHSIVASAQEPGVLTVNFTGVMDGCVSCGHIYDWIAEAVTEIRTEIGS